MKPVLLICVMVLLFAQPMKAQSFPKTAGDFAESCKDPEQRTAINEPSSLAMYGFCLGFLNGVLVSNRLFLDMKRGEPLFCAPPAVTPGQARQVFVKYMSDHPEQLHEGAPVMVMVSLAAAFPCNKLD